MTSFEPAVNLESIDWYSCPVFNVDTYLFEAPRVARFPVGLKVFFVTKKIPRGSRGHSSRAFLQQDLRLLGSSKETHG